MRHASIEMPHVDWHCLSSGLEAGKSGLRMGPASLIFEAMSPVKTAVCSQCDKPEHQCRCDRYCCICAGFDQVRLGTDGLYYCSACMEACDVKVAKRSDA
jgi:hypothetical protein